MRKTLFLAPLLMLGACGGNPSVPPKVTWGYGAGNGDGVQYQGPAPKYSYANGLGSDVPVTAGNMPTVSRGYGADEVKNVTEQMTPQSQQTQVAQPAQRPGNANNHS